MNKATKIITVLGATAAIGALFGILYAPDKGTRTRRKISRQYHDLLHQVNNKVNENRDRMESLKDDIQEQLDKVQRKLKQLS
jgi:gas vesicle protein